jgi:hypothetical protein
MQDLWANLAMGERAISPATVARYRRHMGLLEAAAGVSLEAAMRGDAAPAIKALRKKYDHPGTLANLGTVVMSLYGHSPDFALAHAESRERWRRFTAAAASVYKKERDNNVMTDELRAKIPTCREVRRAMARMQAAGIATLRDSQHFLMMAMSVDNPPKRRDFGALRVLARERAGQEGNYVVVPPKARVKLVMQEYKTAKTYGRFCEELSDALSSALRASLALFPRDYVFVGRDGRAMSDAAYGEFVRTVFKERVGKPAGVNALRHMYVTERTSTGKMTTGQRKTLARSMNHSMHMQIEYAVVDED